MPYKTKVKTGKKYRQTKITAASFNKAVKKVVYGVAETKSFIANAAFNLADGSVYAINLNFPLIQGSNAENIVGEKLFLKNIYVKGEMFQVNSATVSNLPSYQRVLIIRTKKPLTNTNVSITPTDVFRLGTATNRWSTNGMVDLHKVDLLYDKLIYFGQPNQANTDQFRAVTINKKVDRTHYVDTDNGGYFKDKNYYMIICNDKNTAQAGNSGSIRISWAMNFKDT